MCPSYVTTCPNRLIFIHDRINLQLKPHPIARAPTLLTGLPLCAYTKTRKLEIFFWPIKRDLYFSYFFVRYDTKSSRVARGGRRRMFKRLWNMFQRGEHVHPTAPAPLGRILTRNLTKFHLGIWYIFVYRENRKRFNIFLIYYSNYGILD